MKYVKLFENWEDDENWLTGIGFVNQQPFLSDIEVENINPTIENVIQEYIYDYILYPSNSDTDEERAAIEDFKDIQRFDVSYRVYEDGTISVKLTAPSLDIMYQDEYGDTRTINFLDKLEGIVVTEFNESAKFGDNIVLTDHLRNEIIGLFS